MYSFLHNILFNLYYNFKHEDIIQSIITVIQIDSRSYMAQKDWKFTSCSHNILKSVNSYTDQLSSMQSFRNPKTEGFYLHYVSFKNTVQVISITSSQKKKIPGGEPWGRLIRTSIDMLLIMSAHIPIASHSYTSYKECRKGSFGRATISQVQLPLWKEKHEFLRTALHF